MSTFIKIIPVEIIKKKKNKKKNNRYIIVAVDYSTLWPEAKVIIIIMFQDYTE